MHTGKIKKIVLERGFGFITDADGSEVFFHKSSLKGVDFNSLIGNEEVEFDVQKTPKGPSAVDVSLAKK